MKERPIQQQILAALGSRNDVRLFRNNTGQGWVGKLVCHTNGTAVIANARPLHAGLIKGAADLVGWQSVVITPDMVGRRVAIFCSIECKGEHGRATPEQHTWQDNVLLAGGISVITNSVEGAQEALLP
jgi:hypothetical protein